MRTVWRWVYSYAVVVFGWFGLSILIAYAAWRVLIFTF